VSSARPVLHLIGNAHLDPVWLWDWREGLNEGITTCRAILDLMDEDPDVTFIRGESAVYEHIESHDPASFERIRAAVASGRLDPVSGPVGARVLRAERPVRVRE
jgi:alpha-mannosidase